MINLAGLSLFQGIRWWLGRTAMQRGVMVMRLIIRLLIQVLCTFFILIPYSPMASRIGCNIRYQWRHGPAHIWKSRYCHKPGWVQIQARHQLNAVGSRIRGIAYHHLLCK